MTHKHRPIVSVIVAISENFAIGERNMIPWHLPVDLKYFRNLTMGHIVIMGRKTFDSIGRELPLRRNIVVTTHPAIASTTPFWANSLNEAISLAKNLNETEIFIIGGGMIYEQSQNLWDKMYITKVNTFIPNADTFFPQWEETHWHLLSEISNEPDERNELKSKFLVYERILQKLN
jgi:dihydrofolate reductase